MSSFDWQRGKQREHDRNESERLRKLGIDHGETPPERRKTKSVHPNSMAARKWKRKEWRPKP